MRKMNMKMVEKGGKLYAISVVFVTSRRIQSNRSRLLASTVSYPFHSRIVSKGAFPLRTVFRRKKMLSVKCDWLIG